MTVILGAIIVIVGIAGGYAYEHGNFSVLWQPAEIFIIFGAAIGSLLIASPIKVLKSIAIKIKGVFKPKVYNKEKYIEVLSLLYEIFIKMRKEGIIAIEADIEDPHKSGIFKKYPSMLENHRAINFICDSLKIMLTIDIQAHELNNILEIDIEANAEDELFPSQNVARVGDSLPGLGIVAAVLGVVLTMGKMNEPPEVLGESIGAALVGTFMGILMCYGFVSPLAANMDYQVKQEDGYFNVIRIAIISFLSHSIPQIAVEFGRRAIPDGERPAFDELEKILKAKGK